MKRLVAVVLAATLAACSSSSAPLGLFTGTWVGSPDGIITYTIHARQSDSVVSGSGTFDSPSESGSYTVSGISKPPAVLALTMTTGNGSIEYTGSFATPDSVVGAFLGSIGGFNHSTGNTPMSFKRH